MLTIHSKPRGLEKKREHLGREIDVATFFARVEKKIGAEHPAFSACSVRLAKITAEGSAVWSCFAERP